METITLVFWFALCAIMIVPAAIAEVRDVFKIERDHRKSLKSLRK